MYEIIEGYLVERKRVKNINLRVKSDLSVYICAPLNLDKYYIERFIISKKDWIENAKKKIKEHYSKLKEESYKNDTQYKFLNRFYTIKIIQSKEERIEFLKDKEIVKVFTINTDSKNIEKRLKQFEYNQATSLFKVKLDYYAKLMNLDYEKLIINEIKGKWGYCKPYKKIIALNTRLIKRSLLEIEYVIVHELAHLIHHNHSKDFYNLVEKYFKDYKIAQKMLKI